MKRVLIVKKIVLTCLIIFSFLVVFKARGFLFEKNDHTSLKSLLPELPSWKFAETPQDYLPETLFEYINGAAESYLIYDFKKLIVGQYERKDTAASITAEIYDMGNEKNAFGIYSVERFPEGRFISTGNGGYVEEGVLNFIVGKYYIKLLCFDCEDSSESFLRLFAQEILDKVKDKRGLPLLLKAFPREGLVENSEKFILRNFLGYSFFHDGYIANYRLNDLEFDCFIIEGEDEEDTQRMLKKYLERYSQNNKYIEKSSWGYHLKDTYYLNIFLDKVNNYICGVLKIKDETESVGKNYLRTLIKILNEISF